MSDADVKKKNPTVTDRMTVLSMAVFTGGKIRRTGILDGCDDGVLKCGS